MGLLVSEEDFAFSCCVFCCLTTNILSSIVTIDRRTNHWASEHTTKEKIYLINEIAIMENTRDLGHLIRLIRKHNFTNKRTMTMTNTFKEHLPKAIL